MLQLIQRVALEFVRIVSRKKGLSPAATEAAGGKIFTYGSYRLGVYGPGMFAFLHKVLLISCAELANHLFAYRVGY